VYRARDKATREIVALKVFHAKEDWVPVLANLDLFTDLQHPSIVRQYASFFSKNNLHLVTEYCDGPPLSEIMRRMGRPLTEQEVSAVLQGVLPALVYAHSKQRLHRGIRARELVITQDGQVKLADFGMVEQIGDRLSRVTRSYCRNAHWMAPEVLESLIGQDTMADIWSLGITALELLNGEPPHDDLPTIVVATKVLKCPPPEPPAAASDDFKDFIRRLLVKDPAGRETAAQLLEHPFVQSAGNVKKVLADLVAAFKQAVIEEEREYEEEEEEEEDKGERADLEGLDSVLPIIAATILFGDQDQNETGAILVTPEGGRIAVDDEGKPVDESQTGLALVKPEVGRRVVMGVKRKFRQFSDGDLRMILSNLKAVASATPTDVVTRKYEDVRGAIVKQLQGRGAEIPDDFESLSQTMIG
jgi:serine/threonine kinase 3